jgi:hypothetical protein
MNDESKQTDQADEMRRQGQKNEKRRSREKLPWNGRGKPWWQVLKERLNGD